MIIKKAQTLSADLILLLHTIKKHMDLCSLPDEPEGKDPPCQLFSNKIDFAICWAIITNLL